MDTHSSNVIIIDLNQRKTFLSKENYYSFFAPWLFEELKYHINERINELDSFVKMKKTNLGDDFKYLKKYDSIVVEGLRGSGKTTFLEMLDKFIENEKLPVKAVSLIDTNEILSKQSIILVLLKKFEQIIKEIEDRLINMGSFDEKLSKINALKNELLNIQEIIENSLIDIKNYHPGVERSKYFDDLAERIELGKKIHYFSEQICELLNIKSILVPIDDLDMDFKVYENVLDEIRMYMTTPYIIPIVAFDVNQIYLLLKKKYYDVFNLHLLEDDMKIQKKPEFAFLRKLTSEYIQKIFPPSRKITIPDMLDLYRKYLNNKSFNIFFRYEIQIDKQKEIFEIEYKDLLQAFMNVVYGYGGEDIENPEDYHIVNYLKGKTLRSIIDDFKAFLQGLKSLKGEDKYYRYFSYSTEELKKRFRPYNKESFSNKYDATNWFWENYIESVNTEIDLFNLYKNSLIKDSSSLGKPYIRIDEIEKTIIVNPMDASGEDRKEKTYVRLFLQDFFVSEIDIGFKKNEENNKPYVIVNKLIDIAGYFELSLRTVFPATFFEELVNTNKIDIASFPVENLSAFARDDNKNNLEESLQNISTWTYLHGFAQNETLQNRKFLSREINVGETSIYKKHKKFYTEYYDIYYSGEIKFLISPFKYLYYVYEQLNKSNVKISSKNSSLGIVSIIEFCKNLGINFTMIFTNPNDKNSIFEEKRVCGFSDETSKKYINYQGNLQFMAFIISTVFYHLLLNIVNNMNYLFKKENLKNQDDKKKKKVNQDNEKNMIDEFIIHKNLYKLMLSGRTISCVYKLTSSLFIDLLDKLLEKMRDLTIMNFLDFIIKEILEYHKKDREKSYEFLHVYMLDKLIKYRQDIFDSSPNLRKYRLLNSFLFFYIRNNVNVQQRNKNLLKSIIIFSTKKYKQIASFTTLTEFFLDVVVGPKYNVCEILNNNEQEELVDSMWKGLIYDFYKYEFLEFLKEKENIKILKDTSLYKGKKLAGYIFFLIDSTNVGTIDEKIFKDIDKRKRKLYESLYEFFFKDLIGTHGSEKYKNIVLDYISNQIKTTNNKQKENYCDFIKNKLEIFINNKPKDKLTYIDITKLNKNEIGYRTVGKYKIFLSKLDEVLDFVDYVIRKLETESK